MILKILSDFYVLFHFRLKRRNNPWKKAVNTKTRRFCSLWKGIASGLMGSLVRNFINLKNLLLILSFFTFLIFRRSLSTPLLPGAIRWLRAGRKTAKFVRWFDQNGEFLDSTCLASQDPSETFARTHSDFGGVFRIIFWRKNYTIKNACRNPSRFGICFWQILLISPIVFSFAELFFFFSSSLFLNHR